MNVTPAPTTASFVPARHANQADTHTDAVCIAPRATFTTHVSQTRAGWHIVSLVATNDDADRLLEAVRTARDAHWHEFPGVGHGTAELRADSTAGRCALLLLAASLDAQEAAYPGTVPEYRTGTTNVTVYSQAGELILCDTIARHEGSRADTVTISG